MPSFRYELRCEGKVAGIDEAGRGPLAGPVVAAVAVIDRTAAKRRLLKLINDSKQLVAEDREAAYEAMVASGIVQFAVAEATVEEIDRFNILQATFMAMRRALQALLGARGQGALAIGQDEDVDLAVCGGDRVGQGRGPGSGGGRGDGDLVQ